MYGYAHKNVFDPGFGIFDKHVKITPLIKDSRVEQLEFRIVLSPASALTDKLLIGKSSLRVLVQGFHVGMGRRRIEVEIVLLDILSVITFEPGETKHPFFEDRIAAVP